MPECNHVPKYEGKSDRFLCRYFCDSHKTVSFMRISPLASSFLAAPETWRTLQRNAVDLAKHTLGIPYSAAKVLKDCVAGAVRNPLHLGLSKSFDRDGC
jgi:hypothetical protein